MCCQETKTSPKPKCQALWSSVCTQRSAGSWLWADHHTSLQPSRTSRTLTRKLGQTSSRVHCDRTRGKRFKLKENGFRQSIRKNILMMRGVRHWYRLPREEEIFHPWEYSRPGCMALSSLVYWKVSLPCRVGKMTFKEPFKCKPFYDLL